MFPMGWTIEEILVQDLEGISDVTAILYLTRAIADLLTTSLA